MQNQALITCIFSLHIDLNWSLAGCHTFATKDRYIQASRSRVHLLSALFYPTLPHSHLWLHPVNHTSQIAPWLQSTLKWWKWIKLITDSQRESWAAIKSCVWPAAVHSSALLYDRRPGWVPVAFLRQSPSIRSTSAETPLSSYLMHLALPGIDSFSSQWESFSCGVLREMSQGLVSGFENVVLL